MKLRTQMTLNPKFVKQIDEYLSIAGLSRSSYIENCMIHDVLKVKKIINDPDIMNEFNDKNTVIANYFRGKIEGDP